MPLQETRRRTAGNRPRPPGGILPHPCLLNDSSLPCSVTVPEGEIENASRLFPQNKIGPHVRAKVMPLNLLTPIGAVLYSNKAPEGGRVPRYLTVPDSICTRDKADPGKRCI